MDVLRVCYDEVMDLRKFLNDSGIRIDREMNKKFTESILDSNFVCLILKSSDEETKKTLPPITQRELDPSVTFQSILQHASMHAATRKKVWTQSELQRGPWRNFWNVFGSAIVLELWTKYSIFLKTGKTFVQLTGKSVCEISAESRKMQNQQIWNRKSKKRKRSLETEAQESDRLITQGKRHRKRCKRRKKDPLPEIIRESWPRKPINPKFQLWASKLLYSQDLREHWCRFGVFSKVKPDSDGSRAVLTEIFGTFQVPSSHPASKILLTVSQELIRNRKKICLSPLLDLYFPLPKNILSNASIGELVTFWIKPKLVQSFLVKLWKKLLPRDLLGQKNSEKFLENFAERMLDMGRRDCLGLHEFQEGLQVRECPWLKELGNSKVQEKALRSLLAWLMRLLSSSIKSTMEQVRGFDRQFSGGLHQLNWRSKPLTCSIVDLNLRNDLKLLYYRKPLWTCLVAKASAEYRETTKLRCLQRRQVRQLQKRGSVFGPHKLRFIPKFGGVRGIISNVRNGKKTENRIAMMNWKLQTVRAALGSIARKKSDIFGSVKGTSSEIRDSWIRFVKHVRSKAPEEEAPVFMVKADMHACFDKMRHDKLIQVLTEVLREFGAFGLQQYKSLRTGGRKFVTRKTRWEAWPIVGVTGRLSSNLMQNRREVAVPLDSAGFITSAQLLSGLKTLIKSHILLVDGKFYAQTQGIPQGCAISVLLCNLYLGALERDHWPQLLDAQSESLLMRHVDDFLLATTEGGVAEHFATCVMNGFEDYCVRAKPGKLVKNFSFDGLSDYESEMGTQDWETTIPWCGMGFSPKTLEVLPDATRWHDVSSRDIVKVRFHSNRGQFVQRSIQYLLESRMLPLCLNRHINSRRTVKKTKMQIWKGVGDLFGTLVSRMERPRKAKNLKFLINTEQGLRKTFEKMARKY